MINVLDSSKIPLGKKRVGEFAKRTVKSELIVWGSFWVTLEDAHCQIKVRIDVWKTNLGKSFPNREPDRENISKNHSHMGKWLGLVTYTIQYVVEFVGASKWLVGGGALLSSKLLSKKGWNHVAPWITARYVDWHGIDQYTETGLCVPTVTGVKWKSGVWGWETGWRAGNGVIRVEGRIGRNGDGGGWMWGNSIHYWPSFMATKM